MIRQLITFSNDNDQAQAASHSFYLIDSFKDTFEYYKKYKSNLLDRCADSKLQEMEVLEFLDNLGFPLNEPGTILYRNMIIKAMHHLNGTDDFGNSLSREQLLKQMKNPYSQFYVEVARSDLDIGIKTFHAYVQHSIRNINYSDADTALLFNFYSNFSKDMDCGEAALIIAEYINTLKANNDKTAIKQFIKLPIGKTQFDN